jgi:hypothetical protein
LEALNQGGGASEDIIDWPWQLGAPVTDGDGVAGNYNLAAGDRPTLFGDQTAWWVMHDRPWSGREGTPLLNVEIQVTAFAFASPGDMGKTTFFRYRIVNPAETPLEAFQMALSPEVELGDAWANFAGSRPQLDLTYHYRADTLTYGSPQSTYDTHPPALGIAFLPSAVWPRNDALAPAVRSNGSGLHAFVVEHEARWGWDPESLSKAFSALQDNELPIRRGGTGVELSGDVTRYMFDGTPVSDEGWTMPNIDGLGTPLRSGGGVWETFGASTPMDLAPGEHADIVFVVTVSQSDTPMGAVSQLFGWVGKIRDNASYFLTPEPAVIGSTESFELAAGRPYPNPFSESATIEYTVQEDATVEFVVFDLLGRRVQAELPRPRQPGLYSVDIAGDDLVPGTYVYRLKIGRVATSGVIIRGGR